VERTYRQWKEDIDSGKKYIDSGRNTLAVERIY
jgi:hypothetical protein